MVPLIREQDSVWKCLQICQRTVWKTSVWKMSCQGKVCVPTFKRLGDNFSTYTSNTFYL